MDSGLLVEFLQFNSVPLLINSQRMESLADASSFASSGATSTSAQPSGAIGSSSSGSSSAHGAGHSILADKVKKNPSSSAAMVIDVDNWLDEGLGLGLDEKSSSRSLVLLPMRDEMDQLEVSQVYSAY